MALLALAPHGVSLAGPPAPGMSVAVKKKATGKLQVKVTGSGKYTVTGKGFRKSATSSKTFTVKPGVYRVKASGASVKPGKVKVRKGKTVRVKVSFTAPTPGPTPTPTPTPGPATDPVSKGAVIRVNTDANGNGGNDEAGSPTWSPDGNQVAFYSRATNLVPGVTNSCVHVYLKTLSTGAIRVVDTAPDGTLGDGGCGSGEQVHSGLGFSPDGRWLLFCSDANNLGAGGGERLVYGKNLVTGEVEWFGRGCLRPTWSPDGTKIAFATNKDFCDYNNNGNYDIFWVDRNEDLQQCADFHLVSSDSSGASQFISGGNVDSDWPMWSPDSSRILFSSNAQSLVPNDTNAVEDVFVKNIVTNQTTRLSTSSSGGQVNGASTRAAWSPDGGQVAFQSTATDLGPADSNAWDDVFVKNLTTGQVTLVSAKSSGEQALWLQRFPSWAPDGTKIAWESEAVDLVPDDVNTRADIFTKSLGTQFVQLISSTATGVQGNAASSLYGSSPRAYSPDGTRVVFTSRSVNLAPNDNNAHLEDVFVKTP